MLGTVDPTKNRIKPLLSGICSLLERQQVGDLLYRPLPQFSEAWSNFLQVVEVLGITGLVSSMEPDLGLLTSKVLECGGPLGTAH